MEGNLIQFHDLNRTNLMISKVNIYYINGECLGARETTSEFRFKSLVLYLLTFGNIIVILIMTFQ